MLQFRTHSLNVTLKGYSKKFWGLFGQKAHKTQQITLFHPPKGGSSLSTTRHRQTYNPKFKPKRLTNGTLSFSWGGCLHSMCNTAKFSDWHIFQNQDFSLVMTLTLISQSPYDFSQAEFHCTWPSHTYIYMSHISHFVEESSSIQY